MKRLKTLLRDDSGATIVELGLITPVLASLLIGAVDLSFGFSAKLGLEQSAQRGIERVMQQRNVSNDYSAILKPEIAADAGVSEDNVTVSQWLECDGVRQDDGVNVCPEDDDIYARYVEATVKDTYKPFLGSKWLGANADGTYTIEGTAGIRIQ